MAAASPCQTLPGEDGSRNLREVRAQGLSSLGFTRDARAQASLDGSILHRASFVSSPVCVASKTLGLITAPEDPGRPLELPTAACPRRKACACYWPS